MRAPAITIVAARADRDEAPVLAELVARGEVFLRIARAGRRTIGGFSLYPELTTRLERILGWRPRHPGRPGARLRTRNSALLANLEVAEAHRRRGVGAALVGYAIALTRAAGRRALSLYVEASNLLALAFYRALGFRRLRTLASLTPKGGPIIELTKRV